MNRPSGDQATLVQRAGDGPISRPDELPSNGTRRHDPKTLTSFISAVSTHCPSGDRPDRCAMPFSCAGKYTARAPPPFAAAVARPMWLPRLISENRIWLEPMNVSPELLVSHSRGSPRTTGTTQVSQPAPIVRASPVTV